MLASPKRSVPKSGITNMLTLVPSENDVIKVHNHQFDDDESVFLSWTGKCMSSSMVSCQINSFWSKPLGQNAKRISATLIRKTAVSAVHEKHKGLKKSLANLMTHSEQTTEKYCNIQEKGRQDAKLHDSCIAFYVLSLRILVQTKRRKLCPPAQDTSGIRQM